MKVLVFGLALSLASCGYFKGDKGDPGENGAIGPAGERGEKGEDGRHGEDGAAGSPGRNGSTGEQGPIGLPGERGERGYTGEPGNVDYLVSGRYRCEGRWNYNKGSYYQFRLNVWDLSTNERYLNGRSDFFNSNGGLTPDSTSGFGDGVETGSFRFEIDGSRWKWRHLRSNNWGWLNCQNSADSK